MKKEKLMLLDVIIEQRMRELMTKHFYLEGKNKDYYFGKSPLNDALTVFFNPNTLNGVRIKSWLREIFHDVCHDFDYSVYSTGGISFTESAFKIDGGVVELQFTESGVRHAYYLNYLPKDELEELIKREPERWKLYQNYQHQKELQKISKFLP